MILESKARAVVEELSDKFYGTLLQTSRSTKEIIQALSELTSLDLFKTKANHEKFRRYLIKKLDTVVYVLEDNKEELVAFIDVIMSQVTTTDIDTLLLTIDEILNVTLDCDDDATLKNSVCAIKSVIKGTLITKNVIALQAALSHILHKFNMFKQRDMSRVILAQIHKTILESLLNEPLFKQLLIKQGSLSLEARRVLDCLGILACVIADSIVLLRQPFRAIVYNDVHRLFETLSSTEQAFFIQMIDMRIERLQAQQTLSVIRIIPTVADIPEGQPHFPLMITDSPKGTTMGRGFIVQAFMTSSSNAYTFATEVLKLKIPTAGNVMVYSALTAAYADQVLTSIRNRPLNSHITRSLIASTMSLACFVGNRCLQDFRTVITSYVGSIVFSILHTSTYVLAPLPLASIMLDICSQQITGAQSLKVFVDFIAPNLFASVALSYLHQNQAQEHEWLSISVGITSFCSKAIALGLRSPTLAGLGMILFLASGTGVAAYGLTKLALSNQHIQYMIELVEAECTLSNTCSSVSNEIYDLTNSMREGLQYSLDTFIVLPIKLLAETLESS